jgi:hypothetical protein
LQAEWYRVSWASLLARVDFVFRKEEDSERAKEA